MNEKERQAHCSSSCVERYTPSWIFNDILLIHNREYFDLDPCSSRPNVPADVMIQPKGDGLTYPWDGLVFLNPPYQRSSKEHPGIKAWTLRAAEYSQEDGVGIWGLLPGRIDTSWFQQYVFDYSSFIWAIRGRVNFFTLEGEEMEPALFPSILCYWGKDGKEVFEKFNERSQIIKPRGGRFLRMP